MPSRWLRNVTVAYQLFLAIGQSTYIGDLHTADNTIWRVCLILLVAFHVVNMLSAFAQASTSDIARYMQRRMSSALYSVVCRLSTLGLLAALLAGPALSHAMVHSLHLPITCHRSLKSHLFPPPPLVDDRSFVGPSDLVPSTARALVLGLTTLLLLSFSPSLFP